MTKLTQSQLLDHLQVNYQITIDQERLKNHSIIAKADIEDGYFAIIKNNSYPVVIELLSDAKLARNLSQKYESISPAKNIDPVNWIQIICSGQLSNQEVFDLIRLAYDRV